MYSNHNIIPLTEKDNEYTEKSLNNLFNYPSKRSSLLV